MSDSSYYSQHRRSNDRSYSRERDYYHRDDSYRRERRVPGHVTDPNRDVDAEIRSGQREAMERYRTDSHYKKSEATRSIKTKDTMSPPPYNISATQQPFYTRKTTYYDTSSVRRWPFNPSFLAVLTGFVGLGVMVAAIVIVEWLVQIVVSGSSTQQVTKRGLFNSCISGATSCNTLESLTGIGTTVLSDLGQATRGLIIISAVIGFAALAVNIFLGLRKFERRRGAFYSGAVYLLAGCCGVSAMGCYSAELAANIATSTNSAVVMPGLSFYLGWFGASLFLVSSIICFLSFITRWSKK